MPRRRILLVAPLSPPLTLSAAARAAGMTRYLGRLGHEVTLLTSVVSGHGPVAGAARTIRTRDLMVSPLNWRRGNFEALTAARQTDYDPAPSLFASLIVPDLELIGWTPFAAARALGLARRGAIDCVITSSPPCSGHLVGLALRSRGVPWVADLRDGWTFESVRPPFPLAAQRRLDAALERLVVTRADAVVGVTPPITDDLRERFGVDAVTITNGFDPEESPADADGWEPPLDPARVSLVYTGSLSYAGNSAEPLLHALDAMRREDPDLERRLEVVFAGPATPSERDALGERAPLVRALGRLPRARTLRLQRAADALLLFAGDHRPSVATGKLYEYLAAEKPIIVLGRRSVAARIVQEVGAGVASAADDPEDIARAVRTMLNGARQAPRPARGPVQERFAYPALARRMAEVVETAIARAG
jgi:glycosyltransferase involved in cell wall biosynthesis